MRSPPIWLVAAVIVTSQVLPGPALADDEPDLAAAKDWFKEGVAAEQRGDCQTAVERFEQALSVKETPQILLRVGRCQQTLGRLASAHAAFSRARALAAGSSSTKVLDVAQELLSKIDPIVPRLTFAPAEAYEGLEVRLDGEVLSADDLAGEQLVDPGKHVVTASAPGKTPYEKSMHLVERDREAVQIELTEEVRAAPPPTKPDESEIVGPSVPGIVLVGAGVLLVGGGVAMFIVAEGKSSDIDEACGGDRNDCAGKSDADKQTLLDDVGSVDTFRGLGIGLGIAGIGAAAVGAWFLLAGDEVDGEADALTVMPVLSPQVAGISATRRF